MKTFGWLLFAGLFIGISSCKLCKNKKEEKSNEVSSIILQQGFTKPDNSASTEIKSTSISGNILSVGVSYSGGCGKHTFELYFDGNYKKSLPPKVNFLLVQNNNGDVCRSIVDTTLKFDISKSQYSGGKEMMVSVEGFQEIKYSY